MLALEIVEGASGFQCPCGTRLINRSPRRQRSRSRTILDEVEVSSMNTSQAKHGFRYRSPSKNGIDTARLAHQKIPGDPPILLSRDML